MTAVAPTAPAPAHDAGPRLDYPVGQIAASELRPISHGRHSVTVVGDAVPALLFAAGMLLRGHRIDHVVRIAGRTVRVAARARALTQQRFWIDAVANATGRSLGPFSPAIPRTAGWRLEAVAS